MVNEIKNLLFKAVPAAYIEVAEYRKVFGGQAIKIVIAASALQINRVSGQYPQKVSLSLDLDDLELAVQVYGGSGGNRIYCIPDENNPKEKYLAMASRKIAFRKPKAEKKFVLKAIERFALKWKQALKDNREVLMYQDLIDYDQIINN